MGCFLKDLQELVEEIKQFEMCFGWSFSGICMQYVEFDVVVVKVGDEYVVQINDDGMLCL